MSVDSDSVAGCTVGVFSLIGFLTVVGLVIAGIIKVFWG